jgi:hypothetical protein
MSRDAATVHGMRQPGRQRPTGLDAAAAPEMRADLEAVVGATRSRRTAPAMAKKSERAPAANMP